MTREDIENRINAWLSEEESWGFRVERLCEETGCNLKTLRPWLIAAAQVVADERDQLRAENERLREMAATQPEKQLVELQRMLTALRSEEGSTVTLCADNADFNGQPNNAIECCGPWTEWQDRRFTGNTLNEAVASAYYTRAALPKEV